MLRSESHPTPQRGPFPKARVLQWVAFLILVAACFQLPAAEKKFTTSLDRDSIVLGETATLTLTFEGGSPRGMPAIPAIPGLQMAGGSSSFNSSIVNGETTTTQSYSVTLIPERAGDFVVPAITVDMDGKRVQSQPLKLKVAASDPSAPPAEFGDKLAFLWLVLPKRELFVGEVLTAELRLYVRGDALKISDAQIPPLGGEGFTSSKFVEAGNYKRRVGNTVFLVVPITAAVTPVKTGKLALGPISGSVVVYLAGARQRNFDPFDIFGPPAEPRRVALSLDPQEINVSALPTQGVPPGFNGAVGNYAMSFSAGPTNVAAGDPITIKVQISGRGQLDAIAYPDQNAWHDFKVYPPTTKLDTHDKLGIEGTKSFEQVIVPQSSDIKQLPEFVFSFFDPEQKKYQVLTQPAMPVLVRPGGSVAAPTVIGGKKQDQEPPLNRDIIQNKQRLGVLAQARPLLIQQPWFVAAQAVPVVTWIAAWLWRKRRDAFANNPRLQRKHRVEAVLREGFAQLREAAAANQSDAFFATLFRLLQEQLGERLDLPASAITESVIDEELRPRGIADSALVRLHETFQMCNLARYAPIKSSQELSAIIPKFEALLRELREMSS